MAKISEAAETINLCVAHQKNIIDDVLTYSKLDVLMLNLSPQQVEKDKGTHIPILGVTANVREDQRAEMLEAGIYIVMHKPYKMQDLCDLIRCMIAKL